MTTKQQVGCAVITIGSTTASIRAIVQNVQVLVDDPVCDFVTLNIGLLGMILKIQMTVEVISDYGIREWIDKVWTKVGLLICGVSSICCIPPYIMTLISGFG